MDCKLVSGQHVLCLKSTDKTPRPNLKILTPYVNPVPGKVYTVLRIAIGLTSQQPVINLQEIGEQKILVELNGKRGVSDVMWNAKHFKPLEPIKVEDFFEQGLTHPKILDTV